jgi:hypothetical protein
MIEVLKQALEKISTVNAMDYEYQQWAREALAKADLEQQEPVGKFIESPHGNYPSLVWERGYVAKIGDKLYTSPQSSKPITGDLPPLPKAFDFHKVPLTGWFDVVYTEQQMKDYAIASVKASHGIGDKNDC